MATAVRDRLPATILVAILHGAVGFALLHAVIVETEPNKPAREPHETEITLSRELPPKPPKRQRHLPPASRSTALAAPYFNPDTYQPPAVVADATEGIATALSACDPGRLDMASAEVRHACNRIGLALKRDTGHFGVVSDVADPKHWQRELARREAPHLLPCMKAHPPPVVGHDIKQLAQIDLATLLCVSRILFVGYDSEKHERYSQ